MDMQIIITYVVCDEVIKAMGFEDDRQARMSTAEIITFSIMSGQLFGGNHRKTCWFCRQSRYFPNLLSESRLNRRLHKIPWPIWTAVFRFLALIFRKTNSSSEYAVDSFPVECCKKQRIDRRKFLFGKEYIGYAPSKQKYFCGIKVHMVVTCAGEPVEVAMEPACRNDVAVLWKMELDLPPQSKLYADGAYNCYDLEDVLAEDSSIELLARRKHPNSTRKRTEEAEKAISSRRQIVETAFSCITGLLPRSIRASTALGFSIRIMSAILAYSLSRVT